MGDQYNNLLWTYLPISLFTFALLRFCYFYGFTFKYFISDKQTRKSVRKAAYIRRTWKSLAIDLGFSQQSGNDIEVPKIKIRSDSYGVLVKVKTRSNFSLPEVQKVALRFSDAWRMTRVAVTRPKPGLIHIRAVRVDPLTIPVTYQQPTKVNNLSVYCGVDEYAQPLSIRIKSVSGTGVYGLTGYGKTSFIRGVFCSLAPSPTVQFVGFDGKVSSGIDGDYADMASRFQALVGDDLEQAHNLLQQLVNYRIWRSSNIRSYLRGETNIWAKGPTLDWPLLVIIIDECHTYFQQVKDGGDKTLRARNSLAAQNTLLVEDLVKKGRSVGIWVMLTTQKGTADAIPTQIRDSCPSSLSFACKTIDAAIAALGEDIRNYPEASPVTFQDPVYVGVASMVSEGQPGFIRFRNPYCSSQQAKEIADQTANLIKNCNIPITVGIDHLRSKELVSF